MSYSERDGQVILTMSREDYQLQMKSLAYAARQCAWYRDVERLMDRLNFGNPHYTPYKLSSPSPDCVPTENDK